MNNSASSMDSTEWLAEWASTVTRDRTLSATNQAQQGIRDILACLIGGAKEHVPQIVAKFVLSEASKGQCTLVGHKETVTASAAAFANGTAAHVLDFDDSFRPLTGHPSCTIVPAILAVAEDHHKSGVDVLDAYIIGVEVAASLARAAPNHQSLGWHGTATIGVISSAVACVRILGLNAEECAAAISIAVSSSSGTRAQLGFDTKSMQTGMAARDGVVAAYLARAGLRGNNQALTGQWGWLKLYNDADGTITVPGPTETLAIVDPGITYKPYPTCGSTHRTLNAVLDLCSKNNISSSDVESVTTIVPQLNADNLRFDRPKTGLEAKFSMPYTCAVAILYRRLSLSDFTDEAVKRPIVQAFMPKVSMLTIPRSDVLGKGYLGYPCQTTITLVSGESFEDVRYHRRGEAPNSLTSEEDESKFRDCTQYVLDPAQAEAILRILSSLDVVADINDLTCLLRI